MWEGDEFRNEQSGLDAAAFNYTCCATLCAPVRATGDSQKGGHVQLQYEWVSQADIFPMYLLFIFRDAQRWYELRRQKEGRTFRHYLHNNRCGKRET